MGLVSLLEICKIFQFRFVTGFFLLYLRQKKKTSFTPFLKIAKSPEVVHLYT